MPPARPGVKLSIVIAAWNNSQALERCLKSLGDDVANPEVEVIAVRNFAETSKGHLARTFPTVEHVEMSPRTPVPVLRSSGILRSLGEIVALAEDHCTFAGRWSSEVMDAHRLPYSTIGGAVENRATRKRLDWAVYLYDYGAYMLPREAGLSGALSGNNVSYKRSLLREVEPAFAGGVYEPFLHGAIQASGEKLYFVPSLVVFHEKSYDPRQAIGMCFHQARDFAGRRAVRLPSAMRLAFVLGALALPALLPYRVISRALARRGHGREVLRAAGWICVLMASWSLGEFCGYAAGAGSSAEKWV
jgi:GT2 family glycosyltransferase